MHPWLQATPNATAIGNRNIEGPKATSLYIRHEASEQYERISPESSRQDISVAWSYQTQSNDQPQFVFLYGCKGSLLLKVTNKAFNVAPISRARLLVLLLVERVPHCLLYEPHFLVSHLHDVLPHIGCYT
jgi:hypothetical protein